MKQGIKSAFVVFGLSLWASVALAQSPQLGAGQLLGNNTAAQRTAQATSLTALIDRAFNSQQGAVFNRGPTVWAATRTPVLGLAGTATGTLGFSGATSGLMTVSPQSVAGTGTLLLPNLAGTIVAGASSPLVASSTTGIVSCPTCVTSTGGGAITGTAPISVSTAGVVSITSPLPLTNGGTAAALTAANGAIPYSTATALAFLAPTATARLPLLSGANTSPVWGAFTLPASVVSGGVPYFSSTSVMASSALLPTNSLMYGGGAGGSPGALVASGSNGQILIGQTGLPPAFQTASGDISAVSAGGAFTIAGNAVTNAKLATIPAGSLKGNPTASTATASDFTIQGLTARGAPDAANDKMLIFDNASGTFKYVTPNQVANAGIAGVSSFNTRVGSVVPASGDYTASLVPFTAPGTGGLTRTLQARGQDVIYLTDYALCDGSDETTAIQNAIDRAVSVAGTLELPGGAPGRSCAFTGTLTISNAMTLKGQGRSQSMLLGIGGLTQSMISVTANTSVHFHDFWLNTTSAAKTGGYGIQFTGSGPGTENDFATIERVKFNNHQLALDFETAAYWLVRDCSFEGFSSAGGSQVLIRNSASGDAGDNEFSSNTFFGGYNTTTYITWQSSGGTRFRGNKFLGNGTANVALSFQLSGSTGTGLISIVDNSFDNLVSVPISITTATSANALANITINDNRFNGDNTHPTLAGLYAQAAAGSTIGAMTVVGNTFTGMPTGVYLVGVATANVSSNLFGGVTTCLNTATVSGVLFASNLNGGCTTIPASTSASVRIDASNF